MENPEIKVKCGAAYFYANNSDVHVVLGGPGSDLESFATFAVNIDELRNSGIDLASEWQVFAESESKADLVFTGYVDHALPRGGNIEIRLVTGTSALKESLMGAMEIGGGTDGLDAVWSLLRSSGVPEEKIHLEGYTPGPVEIFQIAIPFDGILLEQHISFGGVHLLPPSSGDKFVAALSTEMLRDMCKDAHGWAYTQQVARTLWDAEFAGLQAIHLALAWVEARVRYSFPMLPTGRAITYRRRWKAGLIDLRDVVLVESLVTGRRWARQLAEWTDLDPPSSGELADLASPMNPSRVALELQHALTMWKRASRERDPLAAVVMLWLVLEFLAGMEDRPREELFTKAERKRMRIAVSRDLTGVKKQRVEEVLQMLAQPSLMHSLRIAIAATGVPVSDEEWKLLKQVREVRNDFVHGRVPRSFTQTDLDRALALVNRLLIGRISRISGWEPESKS